MDHEVETGDEEAHSLVSFVLTTGGTLPSAADLLAFVSENFPQCPELTLAESEDEEEGGSELNGDGSVELNGHGSPSPNRGIVEDPDRELSFWVGDRLLSIVSMNAPYPAEELDYFASRAWWWPEAGEATGQQKDHILLSLMGEEDDAVENSLLLSYVTAAVAHLTDSVAIIWSLAGRMSSSDEFVEITLSCRDADPPVPLSLWVDIQVGMDDAGKHSVLYTTGMESLGYPEFEVHGSALEPEEVFERIAVLLLHTVGNEVAWADGDTFGETDEEKTRVHYGPSIFGSDEGHEVLIVEM